MQLGEVIILIFGQVLWSRNRIEKPLINPNQCRGVGIPICNEPTNQYRPHVYPTINIGIWVLKSASITSGLYWLVGSLQIGMPKGWHWLCFIKVFSDLLPNHKPWPNISIVTYPDSIVYDVAPVHIGIFTCSEYSTRKFSTLHSSNVNDIVRMFLPKKCVSAWLSISVEHTL